MKDGDTVRNRVTMRDREVIRNVAPKEKVLHSEDEEAARFQHLGEHQIPRKWDTVSG